MSVENVATESPEVLYDRYGQVYDPAVGPRLRPMLWALFFLFAILGLNGIYLTSLKVFNAVTGQEYRNEMHPYALLLHLGLGFVMIVPFVLFVAFHLRKAWSRPNRSAVRLGMGLLISGVILLLTGVLMVFSRQPLSTKSLMGQMLYWLHVLAPVAVIGFYIAHRLAGPAIEWRYAKGWGVALVLIVAGLGLMHVQNPRQWGQKGAGEDYFFPSSARTSSKQGETPFLSAQALMSNDYCLKCHQDAYAGWFHSAHHFSSFNNLPYRQSILDMRKALDVQVREVAKRDGLAEDGDEFKNLRARTLQATRWCAGCHDPVPFFSGAFDDDKFFKDLEVKLPLDGKKWVDESETLQPTAHAGLTCVSCHGITHINSIKGNGEYTIEEPMQYPFAYSDNPILQGINNYLVKASPDLHKKTFLKPFHRTSEFCSTCHKVHLPEPVNNYKWVRGQNHYDSWHNSGASGFGSRSFYHPPMAKKCSDCHMPLMDSNDFGNIEGKIHNHLFLGANTGLPSLRLHFGQKNHYRPIGDENDVIRHHQEFLKDKKIRVDLFALREGGSVDGKLIPIRPESPKLEPGKTYLLEVVIRNLGVGHEFSQGTIDSNEIWVDLKVGEPGVSTPGETSTPGKSGLHLQSGGIDQFGYVDSGAHFLNAVVLDRKGGRVDRRNAKDIFVPLFNHQVPPSGSQVVHYKLEVPKDQRGPLEIGVQVKYRKFDRIYQDFFMNRMRSPQAASLYASNPLAGLASAFGGLGWAAVHEANRGPQLPVAVLAEDMVTLPLQGGASNPGAPGQPLPQGVDQWERFNDYGIGLLLQGDEGAERGLLRQAEEAFREVVRLRPDYADSYLNLARVYQKEGRLSDMARVLEKAQQVQPNYWKTAWLRGELNFQNGHLDDAIADFRTVLSTKIPERGFDFSKDRELRRRLGDMLLQKAQGAADDSPEQKAILSEAVAELNQVLAIDPEDRMAHYQLHKCHQQLGDEKAANKHLAEYKIYEIDNNARDFAVQTFRRNHPWADHAAQAVVIYGLRKTAKE